MDDMKNKTLCIYHGNCADGFGAAWVVRKALGDFYVEFHAGVYQDPPPDVTGRDVIMVDFSYKRAVLEEMAVAAKSVLILDHHKSAAEDLAGFPEPPADLMDGATGQPMCGWRPGSGIYAVFDMERSGAGITWDHFFGTQPRPRLINHIEDRDLWRFALDWTREIQASLFSWPYDFEIWDGLVAECENDPAVQVRDGLAIERKHHKDVAELVAVTKRSMVIGGVEVPVASLPYTLTSDAGTLMCQTPYDGSNDLPPFAACYWDTPGGRVFSLRSREGGADVQAVAQQYGGGGHRNAAGFRVPTGWEGDDGTVCR